MSSIAENLQTISAFKESVRAALGKLGVSSPPTSMAALKSILDSNADPMAQAYDLYNSLLEESVYTRVFEVYSHNDISGWLQEVVRLEMILDLDFPNELQIGDDWPYMTEYNSTVRISFPAAQTIESAAFRDKLASGMALTLPNLLDIPDDAFADTTYYGGTLSLTAPKARTIGMYAFAGRYLDNVVLPSVLSVGDYAFDSATGDIGLPSATDIGANAFYNFTNGNIDLPVATQIDGSAFSSAMGLNINLNSLTVAQVEEARWFGCTDEFCTFYCSDGYTSPAS